VDLAVAAHDRDPDEVRVRETAEPCACEVGVEELIGDEHLHLQLGKPAREPPGEGRAETLGHLRAGGPRGERAEHHLKMELQFAVVNWPSPYLSHTSLSSWRLFETTKGLF
jgi:hypothetical protein